LEAKPPIQAHGSVVLFDMQANGAAKIARFGACGLQKRGSDLLVAVFWEQSQLDDADLVGKAITRYSANWRIAQQNQIKGRSRELLLKTVVLRSKLPSEQMLFAAINPMGDCLILTCVGINVDQKWLIIIADWPYRNFWQAWANRWYTIHMGQSFTMIAVVQRWTALPIIPCSSSQMRSVV
jgi:hypothetical protein